MSNDVKPLRAYLVDDELLALKRLEKLIAVATNSVEVVGSATDPEAALRFLSGEKVDVLFLDIQMPGMNGFELLSKLESQPVVIFTTAYDKYALKAFEVNSIDYLLKPIEPQHLERALNKLAQFRGAAKSSETQSRFQSLILKLADTFSNSPGDFPNRISSRLGDRILLIDLDKITHFFSEDKLIFAATADDKRYIVDYTIAELEQKLDSKRFLRIHRSTIVNLSFVNELHRWFGGRMLIRMKGKNQKDLAVSRDRVGILKERLGL